MQTKLIAHRGYTKYYPENTLSAFNAALASGADAIELDVHFTADEELVVHHDYYLGSPDNGEGLIYQKNADYIHSLKIADKEHIPTLEEVFKFIGNKLQYEIELKGFNEAFLIKIITLVKKYSLVENIEFTSPNTYSLSRLNELEPTFKTGTFVATLPSWMDIRLGQTLAINNALLGNINVLHCPIDMIDESFIRIVHDNGLLIHAANCDTQESLITALRMGVDQLSTNNLELALTICKR